MKLNGMSREDSLSFFINLYNMMTVHAILTWGYPVGTLDRRKFVGDFKYILGGSLYSLSAIYNGILRANQRPPYTLTKIFGAKDKRTMVRTEEEFEDLILFYPFSFFMLYLMLYLFFFLFLHPYSRCPFHTQNLWFTLHWYVAQDLHLHFDVTLLGILIKN